MLGGGSSSADSINLTPGVHHSGQNHNPAIWLVKQLLKNPSQDLMPFQTKITNLLLPDAFNKRLAAAEQLQDGMPDVAVGKNEEELCDEFGKLQTKCSKDCNST